MKDRKTKGKRVTIPGMAGVEGRVTVAEGEYRVRVAEVTQEEGSAADYLKWKFQVMGKVHSGASIFYNTSLAPQALWNLRGLLEALQFDIPDDDLDVDPDELVGLELMVSVEHDTYEGKKQAKIVDFWPAEGAAEASDEDEDEEEEEEAKPARKSRKSKRADDEDEAPKRGRKSKRTDDEDEEEEDEAPKKSRKGKKESKPKLQQDDLVEMKQDELEDVVSTYGFDLDLSDFPTLRKMRNAVIEAAEEAGVLEE
jgi:hypothetical protein